MKVKEVGLGGKKRIWKKFSHADNSNEWRAKRVVYKVLSREEKMLVHMNKRKKIG